MMNEAMQLTLNFQELQKRDPFNCPHFIKVIDFGNKPKTLCSLKGEVWTNCREVKHCVLESHA